MAGYCTHCGGSGYRKPTKEAKERAISALIRDLAALELLDPEYQSEEGCDQLNTFIKRARRLRRGENT